MAGGRCTYFYCKNYQAFCPNRAFHRFPKVTEKNSISHKRCQKWLLFSRRGDLDSLFKKDPNYLNRNCRICSDHFEDDSYKDILLKVLKPDAIPTKLHEKDENKAASRSKPGTSVSTVKDTCEKHHKRKGNSSNVETPIEETATAITAPVSDYKKLHEDEQKVNKLLKRKVQSQNLLIVRMSVKLRKAKLKAAKYAAAFKKCQNLKGFAELSKKKHRSLPEVVGIK